MLEISAASVVERWPLQKVEPQGDRDGMRLIVNPEFAEDAVLVVVHGLPTDAQIRRDLPGRRALSIDRVAPNSAPAPTGTAATRTTVLVEGHGMPPSATFAFGFG